MNKVIEVGKVRLSTKIKRGLWNVVCLLLFRPFPTRLFWWWRWSLLRLFGAKVDSRANVYSSARIWAPWNLKMEARACLGPATICYNQAMVTLEEGVTVSQYAYLCTAGHKTDQSLSAANGLIIAPITINSNAWVGTRAFINMGVEIGDHAIIGATASIYKDVAPKTIVGGNPAKVIKTREFNSFSDTN